MAELQEWPAWRFGPNGAAQMFIRQADVPEGWVSHPSKLPPATQKAGAESSEAVQDRLRALFARNEQLHKENVQLRVENEELKQQLAEARKLMTPAAATTEPEKPSRGPRKLSGKATPFTPSDETITVDEGRAERLKVLREAGIVIGDDATDGDIEEALDWLEKQSKEN